MKKLGALPVRANEYSDLDDKYRNELPDDHAEIMMPALMIEGRIGIPALYIPMTKADDPAPAPPSVRRGSVYGQRMPMAKTQPI